MNNCYFCCTNAIFEVQMLFLKYKCYFFDVQNKNILSAQYKLLPPYGASFAAFWREFFKKIFARSTNFCREFPAFLPTFCHLINKFCHLMTNTNKQSTVQRSVAFFFCGGGGPGRGVWVEVSLRTACCCQK